MIVELCMAIIIVLPICFAGVTKSRKSANGYCVYMRLISYTTISSWHDNCIKPTGCAGNKEKIRNIHIRIPWAKQK